MGHKDYLFRNINQQFLSLEKKIDFSCINVEWDIMYCLHSLGLQFSDCTGSGKEKILCFFSQGLSRIVF